MAAVGIKYLKRLKEIGLVYDIVLTDQDISDTEQALWNISFSLNRELAFNGKFVTAINYPNGSVVLNPVEWGYINSRYNSEYSKLIKIVIAAHETLSIVGLEHTGNYTISSLIFRHYDRLKNLD